jgi:hypothetical protein
MSKFNPEKLHVEFKQDIKDHPSPLPRCYTLTHSDRTGDLFLTIDRDYDHEQISGWYTQLMRDEVLGEWVDDDELSLHIHCHVSGGLVLGPAKWRASIFKQHLPMTLEAICYGDQEFMKHHGKSPVFVHFHAKQKALNKVENWGTVDDYLLSESN